LFSYIIGLNGGQCVPASQGFTCNCPPAFTGNLCEAPGIYFLINLKKKLSTFSLISCQSLPTKSMSKWWHMCCTRFIILLSMPTNTQRILLSKSHNNNNTIQSMCSITLSKRWYVHSNRQFILLSMSTNTQRILLSKSYYNNDTIQSMCSIRLSKWCYMYSNRQLYVEFVSKKKNHRLVVLAYLCQCPNGYYGSRCENRNYCNPNPCANNGLCTQTTTGYICSCSYPYTGPNCQQSR